MAKKNRNPRGSSRGEYDRDWEESRGQFGGESYPRERFAGESERGGYGPGFRGEYGGEYGSRATGGFGPYGRGSEFGGRGEFDYGYGGRPGLSGGGTWGGYGGGGYYGTGTDRETEWGAGGWGPSGLQGGFGPGRAEPARGRGMRGRGPKGFQRSDESIRDRVCELLEQDDDIDATEIEVRVSDGEVTLTGTADDRWAKRKSEELIENLPGVNEVHNQLRVGRGGREGERERTGRSRPQGETRKAARR